MMLTFTFHSEVCWIEQETQCVCLPASSSHISTIPFTVRAVGVLQVWVRSHCIIVSVEELRGNSPFQQVK